MRKAMSDTEIELSALRVWEDKILGAARNAGWHVDFGPLAGWIKELGRQLEKAEGRCRERENQRAIAHSEAVRLFREVGQLTDKIEDRNAELDRLRNDATMARTEIESLKRDLALDANARRVVVEELERISQYRRERTGYGYAFDAHGSDGTKTLKVYGTLDAVTALSSMLGDGK